MDTVHEYRVGRHQLKIACRGEVGPPTPYTFFLADQIPAMSGQTVVDVGTGSGFLAIVAMLQGASKVHILDINLEAITVAFENAERNGVRDGLVHLPMGDTMIPLPAETFVDLVLSNPAQLPLPEPAEPNSPYYAGKDGRRMIEEVIRDAAKCLAHSGKLLMTHNSMCDLPASLELMKSVGLMPRILAEHSLELRAIFNRPWLDELGGTARGIYAVRDGRAYETLYIVEAELKGEAVD